MQAKGAVTLDEDGSLLWGINPDHRSHGASTAKTINMWHVRRYLAMDEIVTVIDSDDTQNPLSQGVRPGDQVSVHDLIHCSLLPSDNHAAGALARAVGGRILELEGTSSYTPVQARARYSTLAEQTLGRFGWRDHMIRNGSGVSKRNSYTAREIAAWFRHIRRSDPWLHAVSAKMEYSFQIDRGTMVTVTPKHSAASYAGDLAGYIASKTGTWSGVAFLVWSWQHPDGRILTSALFDSKKAARPADAIEITAESIAAERPKVFRYLNHQEVVMRVPTGQRVTAPGLSA